MPVKVSLLFQIPVVMNVLSIPFGCLYCTFSPCGGCPSPGYTKRKPIIYSGESDCFQDKSPIQHQCSRLYVENIFHNNFMVREILFFNSTISLNTVDRSLNIDVFLVWSELKEKLGGKSPSNFFFARHVTWHHNINHRSSQAIPIIIIIIIIHSFINKYYHTI